MNTGAYQTDRTNEAARKGVPAPTVVLAILLSAGCALLARGFYNGCLWLCLSAALAAVAAFSSGHRSLVLAPLLGSAAAAVIYAPFIPVWSAAAVPLAWLICLSAEGRITKNVSLIAAAGAAIVLALAQFASDAYLGGELSFGAVWSLIKAPFSEMRYLLGEYIGTLGSDSTGLYGLSGAELLEMLDSMRNSLLRSLPSITIVSGLVIGWLAHTVFGGCIRFLAQPRPDMRGPVTMSLASACIFSAAYLITLLLGASMSDSAVVVSAENISSVLIPGFFAVGFRSLLSAAKRRTGGGAPFAVIAVLAVGILIWSAGMAAVLFSIIGVINTFRSAASRRSGS